MLLKFTIFKKLLEYSLIFCQTEIFAHNKRREFESREAFVSVSQQ